MIRVVIVDDHPAMRAGLRTVIEAEPGIVFAGQSAGDEEGLDQELERARPDLVLLDYHLPRGDGLQLCYRIRRDHPHLKVLLYSAYASPALAFASYLARANGLVHKSIGAHELFEAIRLVYGGERLLAPISRTMLSEAYDKLDADDRPLVALLLDGCQEEDAAEALQLDLPTVQHTIQRMLSRLALEIPAAAGG